MQTQVRIYPHNLLIIMGVSFNIHVVKKKENGEVEHLFIDDLPHLSPRFHQYWPLFRDYREKIEKIANQKLELDFYEKVDESAYGNETNKNKIFDPDKVKSTVLLILKILKENPDKFPFFYWISFKGKEFMVGNEEVYIGDEKVYIRGGWDECYYMLDNKKIDLTKEKSEFSAHRVVYEKINDKWVDKKGEETTVIIKKNSFYEYYKHTLNEIVVICDYAIKHGYHIQGYLC